MEVAIKSGEFDDNELCVLNYCRLGDVKNCIIPCFTFPSPV